VAKDYLGFVRRGAAGDRVVDGVVRRLQPDVMIMLEMMAELGVPPMESMSPADARAFSSLMSAQRAPGPAVGETVDSTLPGAAGPLPYRLYRPATPGPHAVIVYFHGGGWVIGSYESDDPFCRDLCVRTNAIVVSVDYRHGPEDPFPAAVDDAFAAAQWVAASAVDLGGKAAPITVAGWSAGANLAAVVAQLARDSGGPAIAAQMLLTPVTDAPGSTVSYQENGEGYILTSALMQWFWEHYADPEQRTDPRAAPLRAPNLAGLPPAVVVTCEFDPLRDEGDAYANALAAAGVPVRHIAARGHIHTSITAVDMLATGAPIRSDLAAALAALLP
jgi:acetyl esterase/lipase